MNIYSLPPRALALCLPCQFIINTGLPNFFRTWKLDSESLPFHQFWLTSSQLPWQGQCYAWSWVKGKCSLWGQRFKVRREFTLRRVKRAFTRDFLGKGQGFLRMSHWFKAPAKAFKESRNKRRKRGSRLVWQCTRVQRRSSLGKYIASQGFIYLRLGEFWNKREPNGT